MIIDSVTGGTKGSKSISLGNDPVRGPTIVASQGVVTRTFTQSTSITGSFTVPCGVTHICFAIVGGGGGGGGASRVYSGGGAGGGGGGGGGQVKVGRITAIGGAQIDVIIGYGGRAGYNGGSSRNDDYHCYCSYCCSTAYGATGGGKGGATTIIVTCPETTPVGASPVRGYTGTFVTAYGGGNGRAYNTCGCLGGISYHASTSTNYPYFKHCCGPAGRYKMANPTYSQYDGGAGTIASPPAGGCPSNHTLSRAITGYDPVTRRNTYLYVDLYCCGGWHPGGSGSAYGRICSTPGAGMSKFNPLRVVNAANVGTTWNTLCKWGQGGQGGYSNYPGYNCKTIPGRGGNGGSPSGSAPNAGNNGKVIITYQVALNRNVANELYCNGGLPQYAPPATPAICMQSLREMVYGYTRRSRTLDNPTYPGLTYVQCYCDPNFTDASPISFNNLIGKCYWRRHAKPPTPPPAVTVNAPPGTYLHYAKVCITSWGAGGRGGESFVCPYGNNSLHDLTGTGGGGGGYIQSYRCISVQTVNSTYKVYVAGSGGYYSTYFCIGGDAANIYAQDIAYGGNGGWGSYYSSDSYLANGGRSLSGAGGAGVSGHFGGGGGSGSQTVGASANSTYCGGYGGLGQYVSIPDICGAWNFIPNYIGGGGGGGGGGSGNYGATNSSRQPGNSGVSSDYYGGYGGYINGGRAYSGTNGRRGTGQGGGGAPAPKYACVSVSYPSSGGGGGLFGAIFGGIIGFFLTGDITGAAGGAIVGALFPNGSPSNAQITVTNRAVSGEKLPGNGGSGGLWISYSSDQDPGNTPYPTGKLFQGGCSVFFRDGRWNHLFLTSGCFKGIRPNTR